MRPKRPAILGTGLATWLFCRVMRKKLPRVENIRRGIYRQPRTDPTRGFQRGGGIERECHRGNGMRGVTHDAWR
jgi:hypothetical protein